MGEKSKYAGTVLALFAVFVLVCGTWYLARASTPEPWQVSSVRRPPAEEMSSEPAAEGEVRPDSLLPGEVIDINTADAYDLQRLPGIGEKRAGDIVAYREEHGPFSSVDGLTEVSGIGPGILEGLRMFAATGNE